MESINSKADEFLRYLDKLKNSTSIKDKDKLSKLSNWLSSYSKYLTFEKTFNPQKLINYNRGDVVKINFGFNVGNELGGVHYAVVLDNNNSHNSGTLTVVPLSSTKDKDKDSVYTVNLGNMLNESLEEKRKKINDSITEKSKILGDEVKLLRERLTDIQNKGLAISRAKNKNDLKCSYIKNPNNRGYYLIDKKTFFISPKNKSGLGSLPNGIYDEIYTKDSRIFHVQKIGKHIITGNEGWFKYKENEENISFKIANFGASTSLNEITTFCSHFASRTCNEIENLNIGISQGGENGDLYICVSKKDLTAPTVEALKEYFIYRSTEKHIELYYELKEYFKFELPEFTQYELENPQEIIKESTLLAQSNLALMEEQKILSSDINLSEKKSAEIKKELEHEKKVKKELDNIKIVSKALVSQLTTISKLRIIDPKHEDGALFGVRVDEERLKKIDAKIATLFFKKLDNC